MAVQARRPAEADDLISELERGVKGEVRFDNGSRALYASDHSIYRQVPIGVVVPHDEADVEATVAACRARGIPILGRGTGTSLSGQTCNVAVVIDFSKYMNRILELNPEERYAWVQPGVICDQLREAAKPHGLTFAPDPATHPFCTLGGMIGNNSCGPHSVMGGKTVDNVELLDVLLYDGLRMEVGAYDDAALLRRRAEPGRSGEIFRALYDLRERYADAVRARYPRVIRRVSGYNLDQLLPENGFHVARALVGTESTCALTLKAKVRLVPEPRVHVLLVLGYPDPATAADAVPLLREQGAIAIECFSHTVIENSARKRKPLAGVKLIPGGQAWLLAEYGGDTGEEASARANAARDAAEHSTSSRHLGAVVLEDAQQQAAVWHIRESSVGASHIPSAEEAFPGWDDTAVSPDRLGDYLREFMPLMERYGYTYTLYGHFGDGCVHTRITWDLHTVDGIRTMRAFMQEAADLVVRHGGSLSGEHGDGQARAELLPRMFGEELVGAFREFKSVWDPAGRMNPGKVVDPYPLDDNLRLGADYTPRKVETAFRFPDDRFSFAKATERCFGVGRCRRLEGGTMCPSFRATREEQHTTRGRARLLFEMMRGEELRDDGWESEAIKGALDLCLACKGCKGDCPVSTDVASYKAEFLHHYYQKNHRPPEAYAMGYLFRWAQIGSRNPGLANLLARNRLLARQLGLTDQREPPGFPEESLQGWWNRRERATAADERGRVILWPDTFNNHFWPQTGRAAVEVLEGLGYRVEMPRGRVCCGRPLFDFGFLDVARDQLQAILEAMRPAIQAGVPVVGLEPSCVSVFREELINLLPADEDAHRLAEQTHTLAEFLGRHDDLPLPNLHGRAVLHGHCHQKALAGIAPDEQLLGSLGLDVEAPDTGCCGMGGSFGWEAKKYSVSMDIGNLVVFPLVRGLSDQSMIVADGFSCRSQIQHGTGRRPLHMAEVLRMAMDTDQVGPRPEMRFMPRPARPSVKEIPRAAAAAGEVTRAIWGMMRGPR